METVRVDICYRPLRICWAIAAGDLAAFREAIRLTHTLWGGRYNPVVIVDHPEHADQIVDVFRPDFVVPIGTSHAVAEFPQRYPHLINPFFHEGLYFHGVHGDTHAQVLDIHNALVHTRDTPEWKPVAEKGLKLYNWEATDPLSDMLLMQIGGYPAVSDGHIDYSDVVKELGGATESQIDPDVPISTDIFEHPSASFLCRYRLRRHYGIHSNWDYPGVYLGDIGNLEDLVSFWNLRAADIGLWFLDRNHLPRYEQILPAWLKTTRERLSYRQLEHHRNVAVWQRRETIPADHNAHIASIKEMLGDGPYTVCGTDLHSWNGLNVQAPMMIFGESQQLGVLADSFERAKLSFALGDKPFCADRWFYTQHLVASLSFIGGLYGDDLHTLKPPYIPELNEFFARKMYMEYNKVRIEPGRIGLIIDAADSDAFVLALPVPDLMERIFEMAGFKASPSPAGLITRQIITQMGGLHGAAVFKIAGARRLLRTYGPTDPFTKRSALQLIGGKDESNPGSKFSDFEDLHIERRPPGTKLTPSDVFTYLVERGLFRIGSQLTCPHCRMTSWISLDALEQRAECQMCGREFDATRQLVMGEPYYRRSGILGAERNAQGAVPVALTLQQLEANVREGFYATSLELTPTQEGNGLPTCEVDFVWLSVGRYPEPTAVILGECKDRGRGKAADGATISSTDIANLKSVADALPKKRFKAYALLAKLCPFTQQEIADARTFNDQWRQRVILLTERELEPWHIYKHSKEKLGQRSYSNSAENLADATVRLYFTDTAEPRPVIPQGENPNTVI